MTVEASSPGLQLEAKVDLLLGAVTDLLDRDRRREERLQQWWQDLHPAPLQTVSTLAPNPVAGTTIDLPDRLQPKDGYWWDVRRLNSWGWTAGSVNVCLNDPNGEVVGAFPQAGQFTWGGNILMGPRDRLIFVVTSNITGSLFIAGQVIEVAATILPQYLD